MAHFWKQSDVLRDIIFSHEVWAIQGLFHIQGVAAFIFFLIDLIG